MNEFVSAFDSYNLCLTGDIGRTIATPSGGLNEHIPVVILNDQGGSVMDVSEDITATLRAQDHGHPPVVCMAFDVYNMQGNDRVFKTLNHIATDSDHIPVICFEPGIARREGSQSRFVPDRSVTLRAEMGDNQPAVCYEENHEQC